MTADEIGAARSAASQDTEPMSCEEQALVPTERCTNWLCRDWQCNGPLLVKNKRGFWVCPNCKGSYGKDAKAK